MSDLDEVGSQPTNGQYLLAQLGDRKQRRFAHSMMFDLADLPGEGWSEVAHRSWRTGKAGMKNERRQRAKKVGAYTELTTYWNAATQRNVAARISPMASDADAEEEVPLWRLYLMVRPKIVATISEEIEVEEITLPHSPNAIITERTISGADGGRTMMRMVRGNVGRVLYVVGCGAQGEFWPWDEVIDVASLQVVKIQRVLEANA
jgi:hypothetical protein